LAPDEQDLLLRLTTMFQAGEEAVTLDLLPLITAVAREGRLEEEIYLTTFLFEEAKHTEFFDRVIQTVMGRSPDLSHYHTESYQMLFYEALPQALTALHEDTSPEAQLRASITYNMIIEGVLAETGYHAYFTVLDDLDIMPGVRQGIYKLKQDESRHIAYGIFLISRLLAANEGLWPLVEETMNQLLPPALDIIGEVFMLYDPVPFGLELELFTDFALNQFQKRIDRLERVQDASLDEVYKFANKFVEQEDA